MTFLFIYFIQSYKYDNTKFNAFFSFSSSSVYTRCKTNRFIGTNDNNISLKFVLLT